jgi:sulfur-oxidizing protein SoxY
MYTRRDMLSRSAEVAGMLALLGMLPGAARAQAAGYHAAAFEAKSVADALKALGAAAPVESKQVSITGADIAENGAVVPVAIAATLVGVRRMLVMIEKNPAVLSALFELSDAVEPSFATRVKMDQSSNVYAVAILADGRVFYAAKEIKVTLGGCAG